MSSVFEAGCCNSDEIVDRVIGRCGKVVWVQSWSMYGSVCHTLIMSDGFGLIVQSFVISIAFRSVFHNAVAKYEALPPVIVRAKCEKGATWYD